METWLIVCRWHHTTPGISTWLGNQQVEKRCDESCSDDDSLWGKWDYRVSTASHEPVFNFCRNEAKKIESISCSAKTKCKVVFQESGPKNKKKSKFSPILDQTNFYEFQFLFQFWFHFQINFTFYSAAWVKVIPRYSVTVHMALINIACILRHLLP